MQKQSDIYDVFMFSLFLTHFKLNKLPHTIYRKSRISILGMSVYVI